MTRLTDSSELQEALDLFRDILDQQFAQVDGRPRQTMPEEVVPDSPRDPVRVPADGGDVEDPFPLTESAPVPGVAVDVQRTLETPESVVAGAVDTVEGEFRGDRLENLLFSMCRRGGFSGAVVSDETGLPLAVYNSPVDSDRIAAFTSILGDALAKAGLFLEQHGAEYISMDINLVDKVVVRRFLYDGMEMYLLVLCSQAMDERAEVEMSIEQIVSILG